jgi:hypothetical protein
MSELALGLTLAVVASVALNGSFLVQHIGSASAPAVTPRHPLRTLGGLLRSPVWAAGAALGMTGWALHVAALAHAPLSLVQAFVAGGLALLTPVARRVLGQQLARRERLAVAAMVAGLCLLAAGLHDPGVRSGFSPAGLGAYLAVSCAAAAALTAVRAPAARPYVLGLAGGAFYGTADVAIKALTHTGPLSPWLGAAAACTAAAFFCFQRGLQSGRAVPVIALMTGGTNLVSILGGFVVFGDPLGSTPALAALHAASFVLVLAAAVALAPGAGGEAGYPLPLPATTSEGPRAQARATVIEL